MAKGNGTRQSFREAMAAIRAPRVAPSITFMVNSTGICASSALDHRSYVGPIYPDLVLGRPKQTARTFLANTFGPEQCRTLVLLRTTDRSGEDLAGDRALQIFPATSLISGGQQVCELTPSQRAKTVAHGLRRTAEQSQTNRGRILLDQRPWDA